MFCLLISGMAGLIYEVVWARYLALFLGHTSYAVVAVLAAFMGGLALGNLLFGALADRTARPLAWYAWLEVAIGVYALLFPVYEAVCHAGFVALARQMQPGSGGLLAMKFVFSAAAILIPTVLMGGTLPLLSRLLTRSLGDLREKVAALYFINSAGAVVGTWLADFHLLPALGLESTVIAGAVLNLAAGAVALFVSSWIKEGSGVAPARTTPEAVSAAVPAEAREGGPEVYSPPELRLAVVAIGVSGFVAMLYQVVWTRLLGLALGSSTHAFSLMLMTFIGGITVGSWLVYRWRWRVRTLTVFGWAELGLAASVLLSMCFYFYLPYWFVRLAALLDRTPAAYPAYELLQAGLCMAVLFVPTVCLGATLPLVTRVATPEVGRTGRSVGRVFAVNTLGTVLGAVLTGLLLFPWLGLARTLALGAMANLLLGLAVLGYRPSGRSRLALAAGAAAALVVGWGVGGYFHRTWPSALTMGLWRTSEPPRSAREFRETVRAIECLYHRDGAGATVSVHPVDAARSNLVLKVNGKSDASTLGDMATQLLIGHLPLLLRPAAEEVLVVGLGSGVTAGAVLAHPTVRRVDVVEITPEVVEAARWFAPHNRGALDDPRLRLVIEDAKSFLRISDRQYDVIASEPSNPWVAGVAGVFTYEFYASCRARLRPGGLMVQWVQLYEFSDAGLDMVLATFREVFPYLSLWEGSSNDLMLIGSAEPPAVQLDAFLARLETPSVRADLARVYFDNAPLVLTRQVVPFTTGAFIAPSDTRVHSDHHPALEYLAQRDFFVRGGVDRFRQLDESRSRRPATLLGEYLRRYRLTAEDYRAFSRFYRESGTPYVDLFATLLERWQAEDPPAIEPLEIASRFRFLSAPGELDVRRLAAHRDRLLERAPENPTLLRQYALALERTYREQRSAFHAPPEGELRDILALAIQHDPANQRVYLAYLAEVAWDRGDDEQCVQLAAQALAPDVAGATAGFRLDPDSPVRAVTRLMDVLCRRDQWKLAAEYGEQFVRAGHLAGARVTLPFEVMRRRVAAVVAGTGQ